MGVSVDRKSLVGRGGRNKAGRDGLCLLSLNRSRSNEASAEKKVVKTDRQCKDEVDKKLRSQLKQHTHSERKGICHF